MHVGFTSLSVDFCSCGISSPGDAFTPRHCPLSTALGPSYSSIALMVHVVSCLVTKVPVTLADIGPPCFRIQELQEEVHQLQEKLAQMEKGVQDYSRQVGLSSCLLCGSGLRCVRSDGA